MRQSIGACEFVCVCSIWDSRCLDGEGGLDALSKDQKRLVQMFPVLQRTISCRSRVNMKDMRCLDLNKIEV